MLPSSLRRSRFRILPTTNVVCLNVGTGMLISRVVDFDPITADIGSSTDLASIPCAFRSLLCYLPGMLA